MGTIRVYSGSICFETDSSYGDTNSRWSSMCSLDFTSHFFLPLPLAALKRKILQKNVKQAPIIEKPEVDWHMRRFQVYQHLLQVTSHELCRLHL